jgi:feruloyl esterase
MKGRIARTLPGFVVPCLLAVCSGPAPAAAPADCGTLEGFRIPGVALHIEKAAQVAAAPAHCRVDGAIDRRTGRNGKSYAIGFALALPPDWNGRFMFQGGGGLNGTVNPPVGAQYTGDQLALAQGYAIVSTDSGHQGSGFDARFFEDQQAALDFLYQAVDKVTVVAKQIVTRYYGRPPERSYFVGCSTGGREAMMMSQRHPGHFDGIVAGAPAMRTNFSNLGLRIAADALDAVAPKDAQGRPQTRQALTDADRRLVVDRFLESCDALDGAKDGLVFATQACRFDPQVLQCRAGKTPGCLTAAQVRAVKAVMGEKNASDGRQVYPGYLYDTGIIATSGLAGVLVGTPIPEGVAPAGSLDIDAAAARAADARAAVGDTNAWTNLSTFQGRGGKLLFFHGVSDPWFSALDTVQYYERMARDTGPVPVEDWSRLFLVPGMGHCNGGARTLDRFNMLGAITRWVEQGIAPDRIVATGASMPGESRPLCPFPAHAHFEGGDPKSAASYSCRK